MPGANVIATCKQALPSADLNLGGTSTAETQFKDTATPSVRIYCRLPSNSELSNKMFMVSACGRVTGGTTTNFTLSLDYGISSTIASNTTIEASTARAVDSAAHNWFIQAICMWDTTSNKLQGYGRSMVANLYDAETALNAVATADPDDDTEQGFTVTGLFSSGNAGNLAYVDVFEVTQL